MREWIEFHRLVGVERFFLYDNLSPRRHREVLAPYVDGEVVVHEWPELVMALLSSPPTSTARAPRHEARWIAFIDLESSFSRPPAAVPESCASTSGGPGCGQLGCVRDVGASQPAWPGAS